MTPIEILNPAMLLLNSSADFKELYQAYNLSIPIRKVFILNTIY